MSFLQKVTMRNQTLFHPLTLNQNIICYILCALNWVCAWQDKKKQICEVYSFNILTNYVGNLLFTSIISKDGENSVW